MSLTDEYEKLNVKTFCVPFPSNLSTAEAEVLIAALANNIHRPAFKSVVNETLDVCADTAKYVAALNVTSVPAV